MQKITISRRVPPPPHGKLKRTSEALEVQLAETKAQIDHLESIQNSLNIALSADDLVQIKEELMEYGFIKKHKHGKKQIINRLIPVLILWEILFPHQVNLFLWNRPTFVLSNHKTGTAFRIIFIQIRVFSLRLAIMRFHSFAQESQTFQQRPANAFKIQLTGIFIQKYILRQRTCKFIISRTFPCFIVTAQSIRTHTSVTTHICLCRH